MVSKDLCLCPFKVSSFSVVSYLFHFFRDVSEVSDARRGVWNNRLYKLWRVKCLEHEPTQFGETLTPHSTYIQKRTWPFY